MKDLRVFIGQNIVLGVLEERIQVIDYSPSGYVDEFFLKNAVFFQLIIEQQVQIIFMEYTEM